MACMRAVWQRRALISVRSLCSASFHRVSLMGLEDQTREPRLWRAQPHPAGEQEAGQSIGEPVPKSVLPNTVIFTSYSYIMQQDAQSEREYYWMNSVIHRYCLIWWAWSGNSSMYQNFQPMEKFGQKWQLCPKYSRSFEAVWCLRIVCLVLPWSYNANIANKL